MTMNLRKNEIDGRWFSTGFMVGGVGGVDADKHTLKDAVLIRPGEAMGHGVWIDSAFCADIAARGAKSGDKGLKARFGHPNMCSEALGTFLGRWKGTRLETESNRVIGELHLSSTAAESPKGDLRKYVEEMAAKEPDHFGASIVFTMDRDAMWKECIEHGAVEKEDPMYGTYLDLEGFKSPDPANVKNLPHARCADLHAADLVDDPAATDGMFAGASGLSLAAQMTEWLDTHPGVLKAVNDEPELLNIVTRYASELQPFLTRYTENLAKKSTPPPAESGADKALAAESAGKELAQSKDRVAALTVERDAFAVEIAELRTARDKATEAMSVLTAGRDELAGKLTKAEADIAALKAERDEACRKLAAIEAGAPPVSSVPAAEDSKETGSMWDDARKSKKRK